MGLGIFRSVVESWLSNHKSLGSIPALKSHRKDQKSRAQPVGVALGHDRGQSPEQLGSQFQTQRLGHLNTTSEAGGLQVHHLPDLQDKFQA